MKTKEDLNRLFQESSDTFKSDFAEMRSSLLLIYGEHYNKRNIGRFQDRIRTARDLSTEAKIRLTKNHIGKIARTISNIILSSAPGVAIKPKHDRELQDQKAAELNAAVWVDGKERSEWSNLVMQWVDDFAGIGEVCTKLFYDPNGGPIIGYEPLIDDFTGQPLIDSATGEMMADQSKPIYEGQLCYEEVHGFNVLIDPNAKDIRKSPWYCIRKMVMTKDLKKAFPKMADKIQDTEDDTFMIFDVGTGYRTSKKGETLLKEWFFRPCAEYPKGFYQLQIKDGDILAEGELPEDKSGAIFPLEFERFDYIQTKPRGIACTKQLRPNQLEINRSASKIAEHQVTLGDDKLVMINGSKLSAGASLPGIRSLTVTGQPPTVIEGRSGAQYFEYMMSQIKEMYQLADVEDSDVDVTNLEPHVLLYRAAKQKKKFSRYIQRFENYLMRVCKLYLRSAKYYFSDEAVVLAIGRNERINISEFKNTVDQSLQFVVEPQSEDIETKMGRQLSLNHVLQYVGTQLDKSIIGKLITQMPYANVEDAFSDLTLDYECATNDILALDRGEMPVINPYDPHEYMISRATARVRQSDFRFLPDLIKANYEKYIAGHMQVMEDQKAALVRANSGFIPDGGALIGMDLYVPDPNNPERTRRARIPQSAAEWLIKKIQEQGQYKQMFETAGTEAIAQYQLEQDSQPLQAQGSNAEIVSPTMQ